MMNRRHGERGAIVVESALVVGAIFLMLFGTISVAIVGFDQMSADGAAFEVAHETSVGASAPPNATHSAFPNIPQPNITTSPLPAPAPSVPVNYGYNTGQTNSQNDRFGGVSMVQAEQIQGQASKTSATVFGMPINVVGTMIEPYWLENGLHFDAANQSSYGGVGGSAGFQGNILTQGENTPLYYVGFNLVTHCGQTLPYITCGSSQYQFTPIGVAEYLDVNNWCSITGLKPCSTPAGANGSALGDSTFAAISCHQRVYATIAQFFQLNQNLRAVENTNSLTRPYAYYSGLSSNSFTIFSGFGLSTGGIAADAAIQTAYGWDAQDVLGTPGNVLQNPLYPERGC